MDDGRTATDYGRPAPQQLKIKTVSKLWWIKICTNSIAGRTATEDGRLCHGMGSA